MTIRTQNVVLGAKKHGCVKYWTFQWGEIASISGFVLVVLA